jgi:hypothetical protein
VKWVEAMVGVEVVSVEVKAVLLEMFVCGVMVEVVCVVEVLEMFVCGVMVEVVCVVVTAPLNTSVLEERKRRVNCCRS